MKIKLLSMLLILFFIDSWYSWPVILVVLLFILVVVLVGLAIKFVMATNEGWFCNLYNIIYCIFLNTLDSMTY